jgi:hypothetical protein
MSGTNCTPYSTHSQQDQATAISTQYREEQDRLGSQETTASMAYLKGTYGSALDNNKP